MNTIQKIQAIQNTMNQVAVAGHDNWNKMLGCWQTLEEVKKELIDNASKHENERAADQTEAGGVCGA
jgi:hypothetical protein